MPCTNSSVASRPDFGWAFDVVADQLAQVVQAGLRVLAAVALGAYGASRFHFAEPELNGFGVTTSMPGWRRSSQS